MTTNTANEIESLRAFASAHNELAFAHLCTAALQGKEWAVERLSESFAVANTLRLFRAVEASQGALTDWQAEGVLESLRNVDTSCPDGAIARKMSTSI